MIRITAGDVILGLLCAALPILLGLAFADWLTGYDTFTTLIGALK